MIAPVHECLWHKYGIEARRETDHLSFELFFLATCLNENMEIYHSHQSVADLWKRMTLCKTKVVHINIGTRKDDGHFLTTWLILPILERHIDKTVGHTFEKEFAIEHIHAIDTHRGIHLVLGRGKLSYLLDKLLRGDIVHITARESIGTTTEGVAHTYFLTHDEVVGLHKTVLLGEDRQHILVKLKAEKNDEHTEKVGKGKTCKLWYADMLT